MTTLERHFREQARYCQTWGSPLTAALLTGAADDLAASGITADLLGPHREDPPGSVAALRFSGALHRLVLERQAPELALHYPSVGGTAPVRELWPVAERAIRENLQTLRDLVRRPVQTNEVGRSAALYGCLLMLDGPIRLLELGASAGLNLRCDAFAYDLGAGVVLGDAHSRVRLERPWEGPYPQGPRPEIVDRLGCDPSPLDPATPDGRTTLTSYVWADQVPRLERLRGALAVAERVPARVEQAGAMEFLSRELAQLPTGVTTVIWHSVVWQYVEPAEQRAVDALLERVGAAARPDTPLVRISLEPQPVGGQVSFRVHARRWPGGQQVHVADALGHGPPVQWTGATIRT